MRFSRPEKLDAPLTRRGSASAAVGRQADVAAARRELKRLVTAIVDTTPEAKVYDAAARALAVLRDAELWEGSGGGANSAPCSPVAWAWRLRGSSASSPGSPASPAAAWEVAVPTVPRHFLCPISSEIMRDPVIVSSGQTYDRHFIVEWFNAGNQNCPQTQQALSDTTLVPNHLVRRIISEWCAEHGLESEPPQDQMANDPSLIDDRTALTQLLLKLSPSATPTEQKNALKDFRLLTKRSHMFRSVVAEDPASVPRLLSLLSQPGMHEDNEVTEDMVTTILNLSIHDSNKKNIGESSEMISFLVDALASGEMETRSNAAAALFSLSALESNKAKIVASGAMKSLINLLETGSMAAKKDSASAIFNLCTCHRNKSVAIEDGIVRVLLKAVRDSLLVAESLAILALLSSDQDAVEEIGVLGGAACLLGVIRGTACKNSKENAVVVLFALCVYDKAARRDVAEDEGRHGSLASLTCNGTPRAQRKAGGILDRLKRVPGKEGELQKHNSC